MSTLEKFGILVILILVVIIGVVAVWGVGGNGGANPFDKDGTVATAPAPSGDLPAWPAPVQPPAPPAARENLAGPVPPPTVAAPVTPPAAPAVTKGPAVEPSSPAAADDGTTYEVKKGDTLASIAKSCLGSAAKWPAIVEVNTGLDPKRLKIGMKLRMPSGTAVAKTTSMAKPPVNSFSGPNPADGPTGSEPISVDAPVPGPSTSGREVEVQEGDTFWKIAERELGDGSKYTRIAKLNPEIDPRRLRKGMRIRLPAAE